MIGLIEKAEAAFDQQTAQKTAEVVRSAEGGVLFAGVTDLVVSVDFKIETTANDGAFM